MSNRGGRGGQRGGQGGGQGGGRGGAGGGRPPAQRGASLPVTNGPLVLNMCNLKVDTKDQELWTVEIRQNTEETFYNIKNLPEHNAKNGVGNTDEFLERVLTKEIKNRLDTYFGVNMYSWDNAATLVVLTEFFASNSGKTTDRTGFEMVLDPVGGDKPQTFELCIRRDMQPDLINDLLIQSFRLQQTVLAAQSVLMAETKGTVERGVAIPDVNVSGPFGEVLRASLDPAKLDMPERQQQDFRRDFDAIKDGFVLRRTFDISVTAYPIPGKNDFHASITCVPRTSVRIDQEIFLLDFLKRGAVRNQAPRGKSEATDVMRAVEDLLVGLEVKKDFLKYPTEKQDTNLYFIKGVMNDSAATLSFELKKGEDAAKKLTVKNYFAQLGIQLKFPDLPLVEIGNRGRKFPFPAELIRIQAQNVRVTENFLQSRTTNLCRSQPGQVRKLADAYIRFLFTSQSSKKLLDAWGLSVVPGLVAVPAIVAAAPSISYSGGRPVKVIDNNRWNMIDATFERPFVVAKPILLVDMYSHGRDGGKPFRSAMEELFNYLPKVMGPKFSVGGKLFALGWSEFADIYERGLRGLRAPAEKQAHFIATMENSIRTKMKSAPSYAPMANKKLGEIFGGVIFTLPRMGNEELYENGKYFFEDLHGLPSQCIKEGKSNGLDGNIPRSNDKSYFNYLGTLAKIALGINVKFGMNSINHKVDNPQLQSFRRGGCVFLGADISHHRQKFNNEDKRVSICGLVGSTNCYERYTHVATIQENDKDQDLIQDLPSMLERLWAKAKYTDVREIVYFRGGLDWGSHEKVLAGEVCQINEFMKKRNIPDIKISVLCCIKRHSLRVLPAGGPDTASVAPGTCAGIGVYQRDPTTPSFLMVSHVALGGSTPLPCRVVVLRNDHKLKPEEWADVVHATAYMDQVVTLGVSLPTPAYYASCLDERLTKTLKKTCINSSNKAFDEVRKLFQVNAENIPDGCFL